MSNTTSVLQAVQNAGVSVWIDDLSREMIASGELQRLQSEHGVVGVTTNPSIFAAALRERDAYAAQLGQLDEAGVNPRDAVWPLMIEDVRAACDAFAETFRDTQGYDGRVSLEVDPGLAHDTQATIAMATALYKEVNRPNVMIKIPATREGLTAIAECVAAGISVNVTLIFHAERYREVLVAYRAGLRRAAAAGLDLRDIHGVASFFISRVDAAIDPRLPNDEAGKACYGQAGLAEARLGYEVFCEHAASEEWKQLEHLGARQQRPLWASTSIKDDSFSPDKYVVGLVAPGVVNTMPRETLDYCAAACATEDMPNTLDSAAREQARQTAAQLAGLGIELGEIADTLETEGLHKFQAAWAQLQETVEDNMGAHDTTTQETIPAQLDVTTQAPTQAHVVHLSDADKERIAPVVSQLTDERFASRLHDGDATLWGEDAEAEASERLGWTTLPTRADELIERIHALRDELVSEGLTRIVLCGMGGSSLAPEVMCASQNVRLVVVDTTDPEQIHRVVTTGLDRTAVVIASKSGSTVETDSARRVFEHAFTSVDIDPGSRMIVVTDPGSPLDEMASSGKARAVFHADPTVGGRYSALSAFGLVPSGLAGADIASVVSGARKMLDQLLDDSHDNPALVLGAAMGNPAAGRDKLILVPGEDCATGLGHWIEQLVAESTGKQGTGILPVVVKDAQAPELRRNGQDAVVCMLQGERADASCAAGADITVNADLGGMFQLWETATAVNGRLLGINPFDQPDVESAKKAARAMLDTPPPAADPLVTAPGLAVYGPAEMFGSPESAGEAFGSLLGQVKPDSGYLAVMVYADREARSDLESFRESLAEQTGRPTTFGWGPRFLHSTGQYHKGGPDTGVFLIITCDYPTDIEIPNQGFTFGQLIAAQAQGDAAVLTDADRPCLRLHVTNAGGWHTLASLIERSSK